MATVGLRHGRNKWPSGRRLLLVAFLLLLPLLLMELGVRILIGVGRLPVAAAHDPALELTWMDLRAAGPQDIILFGDSLIQQGIEPRVLAAALGTPSHPVRVFDLASSGGRMGVNRALARELQAEGRLPRVAIIGLSPIGLRTDATWTDDMARTPMGRLFTDCQPAAAIGERIDCRAEQTSALWRWHGRLGDLYQAIRTGAPIGRRLNGRELRRDGFRANPSSNLAELQGQVDQALAGEPVHLQAGDDAATSLAGLVADLRAAGVTPVVVAVPFSPLFTDALVARDPQWAGRARGCHRSPRDACRRGHHRSGAVRPLVAARLLVRRQAPVGRGCPGLHTPTAGDAGVRRRCAGSPACRTGHAELLPRTMSPTIAVTDGPA